jgi:hypothetical protein
VEEFLAPLDIRQDRLARDISVTPRRINEIAYSKRAADTTLGLARYFGRATRRPRPQERTDPKKDRIYGITYKPTDFLTS